MIHTASAVTSRRVITRAASPTATIDGGACGGGVRGRRGEHLHAQGRESNGRDQSEDAVVSTCMLRAASPTAAINQRTPW